jgi:hypothetical protein
MEKEIEIKEVSKGTVASINSEYIMYYDEVITTIKLKSGETITFTDDVVHDMFVKTRSAGEGFNVFATLLSLATEKEILDVAIRVLRRKGIPQNLTFDNLLWLINADEACEA